MNTDLNRLIKYLNFKMECLRDQESLKLKVDLDRINQHLFALNEQLNPLLDNLRKAMPRVPVYSVKRKPKITHKKDGSLSSHGVKWFSLLSENNLSPAFNGEIKLITDYEDPNPGSDQQVKAWLDSLGWNPCTFKYVKNKETGEEREVPQVKYSSPTHPNKGELTASVARLSKKHPEVSYLEQVAMIKHRISIFEGFLTSSDKEGFVVASAGGLTNTLRFKHRVPIVNLPKVGKPWGEEIRGALVCPDGYTYLGSDMVSLESTTKRHYMFPHDPDYVTEMSQPGFDEHLDLAVHAGAITKEQADQHKSGEIDLKPIRTNFKTVNYSAIYGVGPPKLARESGLSVKEAKALLKAYWERNKAVLTVSAEQHIKTLSDGSMWLRNPVSGFYYSLRNEKDIFSTLNQGTGVFVFDTWIYFCKTLGLKIPLQYHDEILVITNTPTEDTTNLQKAINMTNEKIKLNVTLAIDIKEGKTYADVH